MFYCVYFINIYLHLYAQGRYDVSCARTVYVRVTTRTRIEIVFRFVSFAFSSRPSFFFSQGPSRLKIEVTYNRRAGCRSSRDRHVSVDFPIKFAEQLSIDGNQRLLSAMLGDLRLGHLGLPRSLFTIVLDRANS